MVLREPRTDPCAGLWRAVQPAHRTAGAGVRRLLRGQVLSDSPGPAESHEPHRHHLHRRAQQRLSGRRPPCGPGDLYLGRAHPGHLLRLPAHGPHPGRAGLPRSGGHRPGVWQDRHLLRHRLQALPGTPRPGHLLDEPRGLHGQGAPRASLWWAARRCLPQRRHRRRGAGAFTGCSTTRRSTTPRTAWA